MIYIHKSKDGQFYFTIHAKNGQVLVTSETYKRKASCNKAINSLTAIMKRYDNLEIAVIEKKGKKK